MSGTITTTITTGVTLASNPTSIAPTGAVEVATGSAIYGAAATTWTLNNSGTITSTDFEGVGITLAGAGSVTNDGAASIYAIYSVKIAGAADIINHGSIGGRYAVQSGGAGTLVNDGSIHAERDGASFAAGGTVTNAGAGAIYGGVYGLALLGAAGTVTNSGTISAHSTASVLMAAGGMIGNLAGGTITGGTGVKIAGATGTVSNAGTIAGRYFAGSFIGQTLGGVGVLLASGGSIANLAGATLSGDLDAISITGAGNVSNAAFGTISAGQNAIAASGGSAQVRNDGVITSDGRGLYLHSGGTVTNSAGATITAGATDISISGTGALVSNAGTLAVSGVNGVGVLLTAGTVDNLAGGIIAGHLRGIDMFSGGTVINAGLVSSTVVAVHYAAVYINTGNGEIGGSVTNLATGTIAGAGRGLYMAFNLGTVTNAGTIIGTQIAGIQMAAGGSNLTPGGVTNTSGGLVEGLFDGVYIYRVAGSITNAGSIIATGTNAAGIFLLNGGSIGNLAGGQILAPAGSLNRGIGIKGAAGTISNAGTIAGSGLGIYLHAGGSVVNAAGGSVTGAQGITIYGAGTISNAGTIASTGGSGGIAVGFDPGNADRLIVDPGAVFTGIVNGGNTIGAAAISTLELAPGAGTVAGLGSQFTNFAAIAFDAGANWTLSGSPAGLAAGQTITGFAAGDTIALPGLHETIQDFTANTLTLAGDQALALILPGGFTAAEFTATSTQDGTSLTVACFAQGTRIRTKSGDIPVELLRLGDEVMSAFGGTAPITWLGHRRLDCARHPRPWDVRPVRVHAHAFAPDQPRRDLLLSPDHAVFVDGALVPIRHLINGATIVQEPRDTITYWHVELPAHDVLYAEGLPAESYLDTGNRAAFANTLAPQLHPDFAREIWAAQGCAPLLTEGRIVADLHATLRHRAIALGHACTADPALFLSASGQLLARARGTILRFTLPPGTRRATLHSRSFVPAEMGSTSDTRRLGVAVARLFLDGHELARTDPRLTAGWHNAEPDLRWTTGKAELDVTGATRLDLHLSPAGAIYWQNPERSRWGQKQHRARR